jgi:rhodanese-related sulfurtransferase
MTVRILNIAILLTAIVLSSFLVKKFFFPRAQNSDYVIAPDARLLINGINWADSDRTVLLALGKDCKYCSESARFYRRLAVGIAAQTNTRLIALFSEKQSDADAYLKQLDVPIRELRYVSLSSLGIKSVPTLAILDRNGVVTDMWVGKLSPLKESDLMSKLKLEDTRFPDEWSINEADVHRKLAKRERVVLLDIRERAAYAINHGEGARNIPLDELPVRAQNELPTDHTIVLYGNDASEMDMAYSVLDAQGYTHILILVPNTTPATNQPSAKTVHH